MGIIKDLSSSGIVLYHYQHHASVSCTSMRHAIRHSEGSVVPKARPRWVALMHAIEQNDCKACVAVAVMIIAMQICLRPERSSRMLRSGQRKHGCLYVRSLIEPRSSGACAQSFTVKTCPSFRYVHGYSVTIRVTALVTGCRTSVCYWLLCLTVVRSGHVCHQTQYATEQVMGRHGNESRETSMLLWSNKPEPDAPLMDVTRSVR